MRKAQFFVLTSILSAVAVVVCANLYFSFFGKKLPIKPIKLQQITSVQVINLDRAKDRRLNYEKMLRKAFGDKFLGKTIGEEIRFNAVDGKKEVMVENILTGEKFTYAEIIASKKRKPKSETIFKAYTARDADLVIYEPITLPTSRIAYRFNLLGCKLSHLSVLKNIAKQPEGTYGLVLEDDFAVDKEFYNTLQSALDKAPADFDLLKLSLRLTSIKRGSNALSKRYFLARLKSWIKYGYGDYISTAVSRMKEGVAGNQAYLVSPKGARNVLEFWKNNISPNEQTDEPFWYNIPLKTTLKTFVYTGTMPVSLNIEDADNNSYIFQTRKKK